MFPQIKQIQRFVVDGESGGQSTHCDGEDGDAKGIGTFDRDVLGDVG